MKTPTMLICLTFLLLVGCQNTACSPFKENDPDQDKTPLSDNNENGKREVKSTEEIIRKVNSSGNLVVNKDEKIAVTGNLHIGAGGIVATASEETPVMEEGNLRNTSQKDLNKESPKMENASEGNAELDQAPLVSTEDNMEIKVEEHLVNEGAIGSGGQVTIKVKGNVYNPGAISGVTGVQVTATNITGNGEITSAQGQVKVQETKAAVKNRFDPYALNMELPGNEIYSTGLEYDKELDSEYDEGAGLKHDEDDGE